MGQSKGNREQWKKSHTHCGPPGDKPVCTVPARSSGDAEGVGDGLKEIDGVCGPTTVRVTVCVRELVRVGDIDLLNGPNSDKTQLKKWSSTTLKEYCIVVAYAGLSPFTVYNKQTITQLHLYS